MLDSPAVFDTVIDDVLAGVVSIDVERRFRHRDFVSEDDPMWDSIDPEMWDEEFEIPTSGSGFVIDSDGHIITNDHVVRDATRIDVHMPDGRRFPAELIGRDPMTDVAVLKIESVDPLPPVTLGNSDSVKIGDWVVAIGNPLGMLEGSVTLGIVSGKGRSEISIRGGGPSYQDFIQTDASINPGNSGGPLVNGKGEVVGVNTAFDSPGRGIGFAISINMASQVAEQLIEKGRVPRGFLGVSLMELDNDLARGWGLDGTQGVVVTDVQPETPAAASGFQGGDIIVEFDGVAVERVQPFRVLVAATEIGRPVKIALLREGRPREIEVRLIERIDPIPALPERTLTPAEPVEDLGLILSPAPPLAPGVRVDSVLTGSPAARSGIASGDRILKVGWTSVATPTDLHTALVSDLEERGVVVLQVSRNGYRTYVTVRGE